MIKGDEKNCGKWKIGFSNNILWANIIQSDQSEYIPGRALLKEQFPCCTNEVTLRLKLNYQSHSR